ncbi:hypothetical protein [Pseudomonas fluorescens]|uniref:hypothetical protein n=1 Tax=Pseudomonas fluorescens TaxID=294 RepID=UPI001255B900|nr:hypothetical protein [Pseudomonas fluorescens]VVO74412.1 hypothetical protein PS843_01449 [Pseudomonas fluorescens]
MSSKSDRDNRSNQLNPNNSAYHSSRADNGHSDDDYDDNHGYRQSHDYHTYIRIEPKIEVVGDYGVGFVTADGTPRFFTFQLEASDERGLFSERTLRVRVEDYLDRFTQALFWVTTSHYKARPALFVIFDGTSNRLSWHVPLHLDRPDLMKESLLENKPRVEGAADPEKLRSLLCSVLQPPYENWGAFEAEFRSASTLRFIYEQRCRKALAIT